MVINRAAVFSACRKTGVGFCEIKSNKFVVFFRAFSDKAGRYGELVSPLLPAEIVIEV
jgi:hypothetical protein